MTLCIRMRISTEFPKKLSLSKEILGHPEDTNLVSGRSLSDHNVPSFGHHGNSVGIQQLSISLANLTKLELEVSLLVKHLDPVVVGVSHNDLIVFSDSYSAWFSELTLQDTKLTKLAMVDHFLTSYLSFGWVSNWC